MARSRTGLVWIALAMGSGCDSSEAPSASWDLAAQGLYTATVSDGGNLVLVGSLNHGGSLWRTIDQERLFDWNHRAGEFSDLVAVAFSPDGQRAITTDPRTLVLWDTQTGESLGFWATPGAVHSVALGSDGRTVLMGLKDHSALVFDAVSGAYRQTLLHEGEVISVDVSRDGRIAITGSADETARLWDLASGAELHRLALGNPARLVRISDSGQLAFTAAQGRSVQVWNATTGAAVFELTDRNTGVMAAAFSGDDTRLLVGYVNRTIELWDLSTQTRIRHWRTEARNPWHETGAAVLAVGFGTAPGIFWALSGDGRMVQLRQT